MRMLGVLSYGATGHEQGFMHIPCAIFNARQQESCTLLLCRRCKLEARLLVEYSIQFESGMTRMTIGDVEGMEMMHALQQRLLGRVRRTGPAYGVQRFTICIDYRRAQHSPVVIDELGIDVAGLGHP